MLRKTLLPVLVILLALSALAAEPRQVTILYSNDFHAAVAPMKATWLVDQPMIGGAKAFAGWVGMLRRNEPNPFLFDSGDLYTGQAISSITKGQALIDIFKAIGFDAVCLGNHEFDYGVEGAAAYQNQEPFPVLAANLFYRDGGKPFAKPYAIVEHNGIKIGVIGIFGVDAVPSTGPAIWKTLEARDPLPILRELIPTLRKQVNLIVVLAHQGETGPMQSDAEAHPEVQREFNADKATVEAVPGIDVFIGGHAHRGIEIPWVSPKTGSIVVQTYGRGTTVGVLKLTIDERNKVTAHDGSLVRVTPGVFPTPPGVERVIDKWIATADQAGKEKFGTIASPLVRNYDGESQLGDLITDAMLWRSHADIAFENAGGIRGDLGVGNVTRYDLISVMPFINTLTTIKLTGKQVQDILEQSLTLKVGMMQVGGIKVTYDLSKPEYHRVISVVVGEKPLDADRTYTVVTNSFISGGGDHYTTFLSGKDLNDTGENLVDAVVEYVRQAGQVAVPQSGRLVAVHAATGE